ncbi:MAG: hypothetical protein ABI353_17355 [Isosphaeraceae bacterium]
MRSCPSSGAIGKRRAGVVVGLAWFVLGAIAWQAATAQEPTDAGPPADGPQPGVVADLVTRYHLFESYSTKGGPGAIGAYRVAFRETENQVNEVAQGAPRRTQRSIQTVYTERPVQLGFGDERNVTALVRRYETMRASQDPFTKILGHQLLDGLTIWYQKRSSDAPLILSLTPGRRLLEAEYQFALETVFVPNLAFVLPEYPRRIGESWDIPPEGAEELIGQNLSGGGLIGKLSAIQAEPKGTGQVAVIDVSGRVSTQVGDTLVRARVLFAFAPQPSRASDKKDEKDLVEAQGAIVKISLGQSSTAVEVGPKRGEERLKQMIKRELILERRLDADAASLTAPGAPPEATEENSWLTYVDLKGRFTFRHPQDLLLIRGESLDVIHLGHRRESGGDLVELTFTPKGKTSSDEFFKRRAQPRSKLGLEIIPGATQALAGWPESMRAVRASAAARPSSRGGPDGMYFFDYAVQFSQNASLTVGATTTGEAPLVFRDGIEAMLKTFRLGPPDEVKR